MREAPSIVLASRLLAEGADVRAWDPVADASGILRGVTFADTVLDAVRGADAAVVVTGWDELRELPRAEIREAMRTPLIVDGRNVVDPETAHAAGFTYEGVGRSSSVATCATRARPARATRSWSSTALRGGAPTRSSSRRPWIRIESGPGMRRGRTRRLFASRTRARPPSMGMVANATISFSGARRPVVSRSSTQNAACLQGVEGAGIGVSR